jgi:tetratricopeptide (TPR) repeat protein
MRKFSPFLFFFIIISVYISPAFAQNYGAKTIFKKYNDAVVVVYACDSYGRPVSQGSGVVLNSQGLIVTNYHVCKGSDKIKIKHEDLIMEDVRILGGNEIDDIMFLKVAPNNFDFIPAGNSDNLEVGQKVFALGSPLGFENSITEGIVNGIRKYSEYSEESYLQISASITHGSSGGALITAGGKLIGVTFGGTKENQNINFAIPINKILASDIYIANKYDEPLTEKKEKKTKKKKTTDGITSNSTTEKKTKKPKKKKKDTNEIKSGAPSENIAKVPGKSSDTKSTTSAPSSGVSQKEYYDKGEAAFYAKDYAAAIELFSKSIQADPSYLPPYYGRGLCYANLEKYEPALSDFNFILRERPDFPTTYSARGFIYQKLENFTEAIKDYTAALELDKTDKLALYGLGECYYETEAYSYAVYCLTTYMLFDDKDSWVYYLRGRCLIEGNLEYEYIDACEDFNTARRLGLDDASEMLNKYCK